MYKVVISSNSTIAGFGFGIRKNMKVLIITLAADAVTTILFVTVKAGQPRPLYYYQRQIVDALEAHRLIAVTKARSVGVSELLLRWLEWKAVSS